MTARSPEVAYDLILIDAFRGLGYQPSHLSTLEFFEVCKLRLASFGVIAINVLRSDPLLVPKIHTLSACFRHVSVHFDPLFLETYVVLGTDGPALDLTQRQVAAGRLQDRFGFNFPFVKRATDLKPLEEQSDHLSKFGPPGEYLRDSRLPDIGDSYKTDRDTSL